MDRWKITYNPSKANFYINVIDDNNYPVNILLTIHDEIVTECREDFALEWKSILESTMIEAAEVIIKTVPIVVEGVITDYWTK